MQSDYELLHDEFMEFIALETSMWKDYHDFWLNANMPVHIIRYEDILQDPYPVLKNLLEFIFGEKDISGTKLDGYLKLAVKEKAP